jgi:hypothetical protein
VKSEPTLPKASLAKLSNLNGQKILICGAARNVGSNLNAFVEVTEKAFADFGTVEFCICESMSTDNTQAQLEKLRTKKDNFHYLQDPNPLLPQMKRTARISSARSAIQRIASEKYSDFEYVAMMDLDGVNRDLTLKSIRKSFEFEGWDAIFANQPLRYYDIWALRASGWNERDCWREFETLLENLPRKEALRIAVTKKMKSISPKSEPILVDSAFGGLGIYRMEAFLNSDYLGVDSAGDEVCEHVYFNQTLTKKGYKLYVMPSLVNLNKRSQRMNIVKEFILRITGRLN